MNKLAFVVLTAPFLAASSCTTKSDLPDAAAECPVAIEVQTVPRDVYVPLPERVTREVIDPMPEESETWGEAKRDADRRSVLLSTCNDQLREAREMQGRIRGEQERARE